MSKKTIDPARKRIQARGFLHFTPGSAGSRNSAHYFPRLPDFSDPAVIVSHRELLEKPSMVSHREPIAELEKVSKTPKKVPKTPKKVPPRGNQNQEPITKEAQKIFRKKNGHSEQPSRDLIVQQCIRLLGSRWDQLTSAGKQAVLDEFSRLGTKGPRITALLEQQTNANDQASKER